MKKYILFVVVLIALFSCTKNELKYSSNTNEEEVELKKELFEQALISNSEIYSTIYQSVDIYENYLVFFSEKYYYDKSTGVKYFNEDYHHSIFKRDRNLTPIDHLLLKDPIYKQKDGDVHGIIGNVLFYSNRFHLSAIYLPSGRNIAYGKFESQTKLYNDKELGVQIKSSIASLKKNNISQYKELSSKLKEGYFPVRYHLLDVYNGSLFPTNEFSVDFEE